MVEGKYIIDKAGKAYIFPIGIMHAEYAKHHNIDALRAGYWFEIEGKIECWGDSKSLNLKSDPCIDSFLVAVAYEIYLNEQKDTVDIHKDLVDKLNKEKDESI